MKLSIMKAIFIGIAIWLLLPASLSHAQNSDSDSVKRRHRITWTYFKTSFDDDFFNIAGKGTDQYYTGGWQLDAFYKRNVRSIQIADAPLMRLAGAENLYFYGVSRRIYTPANISAHDIVFGDHPYASIVLLQHGMISSKPQTNECLITEGGIGAIGPVTYGGEIQKAVHRVIHSKMPNGWDNQIKNNLLLDYKINYEKQVFSPSENLKFLANVDCEAGTLVDNIGAGITLGFGNFTKFYISDNLQIPNSEGNTARVRCHFYMHPMVRLVAYNATLQGGFFSDSDPYVIKTADVNYIYFQYDMGMVLVYRRWGLSLSERTRTAEFTTGTVQQVGNVTITLPL